MAHPNARLTPVTRLDLVREVEAGYAQAEVARRFRVSRATVAKWVRRFREEGIAGLEDRASTPRSNPRRTAPELESRICAVRRGSGFGPHRIAWALGLARSTVYAVLCRFGLNRLDQLHRVTRRRLRYEHPAPGLPRAGARRVRPARCARQARAHGQREGLHRRSQFPGDGRRRGGRAAAHPTLPSADERDGRALHPNPAERVGLCPPLPFECRAATRTAALALPLQSPSTTRRHQRGRPRLPSVNNLRGKYS